MNKLSTTLLPLLAIAAFPVLVQAAPAVGDVGAIAIKEVNNANARHHFMMSVPIKLSGTAPIDIKDVTIQVDFYDLVDDKPQRSNGTVNHRWSTAPVDWRDGDTETLEIEFSQPIPAAEDAKRNYCGYIIRAYYKNELFAIRAEPKMLGETFPTPKTVDAKTAP